MCFVVSLSLQREVYVLGSLQQVSLGNTKYFTSLGTCLSWSVITGHFGHSVALERLQLSKRHWSVTRWRLRGRKLVMAQRTFQPPRTIWTTPHHDRNQQPEIRAVVPPIDANKRSVRISAEESHIMGRTEECLFQGRQLLLLVVGEARDSSPVLQRVRYVSCHRRR